MKPDELQKDIVEASNLALKDGMGTDELVITLLSNAVVAASHLGLSKQFVEDQFIDAVDDIYGEEEEDEECECHCGICKTDVTEEKEAHQASPEMMKFFEKLLELKGILRKRTQMPCIGESSASIDRFFQDIHQRLDEIIKEKK